MPRQADDGSTMGLGESWLIQRRVIWALLMRELLTRYGRHNIGFFWLFLEPMLFTVGVTILWTISKATHGSSLPIVAFALTGYSSVLLWRNMPGRCILAIEPNLSLLYHRYVKLIDIFLARLVLEILGVTISFAALSCFFIFIGWMRPPEDSLKVVAAWFLLAWFGSALAVFLGSFAYGNDLVDRIWHPASYFLFPLSGAAFMIDVLPVAAQKFLLWVPMVHGVELLREGYFGSAITAHYDAGYIACVSAALTLLGLTRLQALGREVTPE